MRLGNETEAQFLRRVRQVLSADDVGIRFADQVGPEVTLTWLASRAPIDVLTPLRDPPAEVRVRAARRADSGAIESGCRITWEWRGGSLRVLAIDLNTALTEYTVILGLER